ncbi:MAG: hypothetical protein K0R80_2536 [Clostridia bacterium]|jgi:hypothetical protein|nr:hypothetical protein [Clostridia bacterium]
MDKIIYKMVGMKGDGDYDGMGLFSYDWRLVWNEPLPYVLEGVCNSSDIGLV